MNISENMKNNRTYEDGIMPYIEWIIEQINIVTDRGNIDTEIGIKLLDMKNAMGSDFIDKNDNTTYCMLRDIFLENGIKMRQKTVRGEKILYLSFADSKDIISAKDARWLRQQKSATNQGIGINYVTNRNYITGRSIPMNENTECSHYFGTYIEKKYVINIFEDVEIFEYQKNEYGRIIDRHRPYDWICKNGYTIKHVASCIREDKAHVYKDGIHIPYFHFLTKRNKEVDYWLLSGWDNRESLEPLFVWMVEGKEDFVTQAGKRPFWDRESFTIYITKNGLNRMSGYLIENKLEELKDVCNMANIRKKDKEIKNIIDKYLNRKKCKREGRGRYIDKDNMIDENDILDISILLKE